ncbi:unnamed protein product [Spirodela intermedia]|uniref:Uncharacterized protein n=1 Tax=Spirodela intermedia TaxID=51605 RepID=A0A7I8J435_SPIIN|nr:unnamed protein product [Spirodela intermedia]CAA6665008.1 unnamed protein product [Spirodela intermedia]
MPTTAAIFLLLLLALLPPWPASANGVAHPRKLALVQQKPLVLEYHNGTLLKGNYSLNIVWYGAFSASQRAVVVDFLTSLPAWVPRGRPRRPLLLPGGAPPSPTRMVLPHSPSGVRTILSDRDIRDLAAPGRHRGSITVILTASDVTVEGFCMNRCGSHGSARLPWGKNRHARFAYIWVGNSASQCPGQCAWPFHGPIYGPQTPPLVAPNGDVGADGMVINLATLLAGTVTNPFDEGFFQGPKEEPLEAVSACTGIFGTGAYPGYPGQLLVDRITGASYNAVGASGRKYLVPAMWDPKTSQCATLV